MTFHTLDTMLNIAIPCWQLEQVRLSKEGIHLLGLKRFIDHNTDWFPVKAPLEDGWYGCPKPILLFQNPCGEWKHLIREQAYAWAIALRASDKEGNIVILREREGCSWWAYRANNEWAVLYSGVTGRPYNPEDFEDNR